MIIERVQKGDLGGKPGQAPKKGVQPPPSISMASRKNSNLKAKSENFEKKSNVLLQQSDLPKAWASDSFSTPDGSQLQTFLEAYLLQSPLGYKSLTWFTSTTYSPHGISFVTEVLNISEV